MYFVTKKNPKNSRDNIGKENKKTDFSMNYLRINDSILKPEQNQ